MSGLCRRVELLSLLARQRPCMFLWICAVPLDVAAAAAAAATAAAAAAAAAAAGTDAVGHASTQLLQRCQRNRCLALLRPALGFNLAPALATMGAPGPTHRNPYASVTFAGGTNTVAGHRGHMGTAGGT